MSGAWPSNGDLNRAMDALPFASCDEIAPGRTLVLAPHPDDESLGCGGLVAALAAAGRPPFLALLTDGSRSHPNSRAYPPPRLAALRETEFHAAASILGVPPGHITCLRLADGAAPHEGPDFDAAAARLAALVTRHGIRTILATWIHDPHGDHVSAARLAAAAARATGATHLAYPVWFRMTPPDAPAPVRELHGARLDITAMLAAKRRAIAAHRTQTGLITDDPEGFTIPDDMRAIFERPFEVFLDRW